MSTYTVEAILTVKDESFSRGFKSAGDAVHDLNKKIEKSTAGVGTFKSTMLGMAAGTVVAKGLAVAWGTVSDSLGSALKRIDTLKQFSKSIELMTGSSTEASRALALLSAEVKGTAYGTDTASKSIRAFVNSSYDIEKATGYVGRWGDAVAVYGDGTDATFERVMSAMNKMGTKGKASLKDIQVAVEAGVPVLEIYANATGKTTEQISKELSNGSIKAQEFFDTMEEAFRKGTSKFPAIAGEAKKAGDSWAATFANMKAATTRGMVSIIEAIENGRKSINSGGMKDGIKRFGEVLESIMNKAGVVLGFVAKHFETLATVAVTALTAMSADAIYSKIASAFSKLNGSISSTVSGLNLLTAGSGASASASQMLANAVKNEGDALGLRDSAIKLGLDLSKSDLATKLKNGEVTEKQAGLILAEAGALTVKSTVVGIMTGKITLVTGAQMLWNKALSANPIGLVVVAVTGFVAGLKKLNNWLNKTSENHKKANEEAKNQAQTNEKLAKGFDALADSATRQAKSNEENAKSAKGIVNNIKDLSKSSMDAKDKQKALNDEIEALKKIYPEIKVEILANGEAVVGGNESLAKQVDLMTKIKDIDTYGLQLENIRKLKIEQEAEIEVTRKRMQIMEEEGTSTQKAWLGLGSKVSEGYKELGKTLDELEDGLARTTEELDNQSVKAQELAETKRELESALRSELESQSSLRDNYGLTTSAILTYCDTHNVKLEEAGSKATEYAEKYGLTTDQVIEDTIRSGKSIEEWAQSYDSAFSNAISTYEKFYDVASSGFSQIKQAQTVSAEEWAQNIKSDTETTKNWTENMNRLIEAGVGEATAELQKMGVSGAEQARMLVEALENKNGGALGAFADLTEGAKTMVLELNQVYADLREETAKAVEVSAMVDEQREQGRKVVEAVAKGIAEGKTEIEEASRATGEAVAEAFEKAITAGNLTEKGNKAGLDIVEGINQPLAEGLTKTEQEFNKGFTKVGETVTDKSKTITTATEQLAKDMTQTAHKSMEEINAEYDKGGTLATQTIDNNAQSLLTIIHQLPGEFRSVGEQAGQGLAQGLDASMGAVLATARNLANAASAEIRQALDIHSPSRVMEKIGRQIGKGVEVGMDKSLDGIRTSAERLSAASIPTASVSALTDNTDPNRGTENRTVAPLEIMLSLGGKAFKTFVNNISAEQGKELELLEAYGV